MTETGGPIVVCISGKVCTSMYHYSSKFKMITFKLNFSNCSQFYHLSSKPGFHHSITDILEAINTLIQKIHIQILLQLKCLEEHGTLKFILQMMVLVLHSYVRSSVTYTEQSWQWFRSVDERESASQARVWIPNCPNILPHDIQRPDWVQNCCWYIDFFAALLSFYFRAEKYCRKRKTHEQTSI